MHDTMHMILRVDSFSCRLTNYLVVYVYDVEDFGQSLKFNYFHYNLVIFRRQFF